MILTNKLRELKAALMLWSKDSGDEAPLDAVLTAFERDLRVELGLPRDDSATIGISFDENIQLIRVPDAPTRIEEGFYQSRDGHLQVEVQFQTVHHMVVFEIAKPDGVGTEISTMSASVFSQMFVPKE